MAARTTLALAATLMLAGDCTSRSTGADPGADSSGRPAAGSSTRADSLVAVALSAPTLRPGAPVRITVTVRNPGAAPLALETATACVTDFEVLDAAGTVVAQSGLMCLQALTTTTLAPGATRDDVFTLALDGPDGQRLAPGRYAVRGVLSLMSAPRRSAAVALDVAP